MVFPYQGIYNLLIAPTEIDHIVAIRYHGGASLHDIYPLEGLQGQPVCYY